MYFTLISAAYADRHELQSTNWFGTELVLSPVLHALHDRQSSCN
jgi:hypothetical protein